MKIQLTWLPQPASQQVKHLLLFPFISAYCKIPHGQVAVGSDKAMQLFSGWHLRLSVEEIASLVSQSSWLLPSMSQAIIIIVNHPCNHISINPSIYPSTCIHQQQTRTATAPFWQPSSVSRESNLSKLIAASRRLYVYPSTCDGMPYEMAAFEYALSYSGNRSYLFYYVYIYKHCYKDSL